MSKPDCTTASSRSCWHKVIMETKESALCTYSGSGLIDTQYWYVVCFFFVIRKCEVYVSIKHRYQTVEQSTRISRRGHTAEDPKSPNTSRPKKFKYYRSHPRSLSRFPYLYLLEAPAIDHRDATFVQAAVKTLLEATGGLEDDGQLRMHLNLLQRALERTGRNIICRKNF